jgi:hypothetical protein
MSEQFKEKIHLMNLELNSYINQDFVSIELPRQLTDETYHDILRLIRLFERQKNDKVLKRKQELKDGVYDEIRRNHGLVKSEHGGWKLNTE